MPTLEFWYEFASTYSYPAALRIEAAASRAGISVRWRPFLLGPIFAAQGMKDSPFNIFPVKGRYMWRDMQRICDDAGLPWRQPSPFPQNGILAARCTLALDDGARPDFSKSLYTAQFGDGKDIGDQRTVASALTGLGHDAATVMAKAATQPVKDDLRANTDEAQRLGIFGAPAFVTPDGELFWGNDRLDRAIAWTVRPGAA